MYSVFIEMPLGNTSRPHEFEAKVDAQKLFDSFVRQMQPWKKFRADVLMIEDGKKIDRSGIENNA